MDGEADADPAAAKLNPGELMPLDDWKRRILNDAFLASV